MANRNINVSRQYHQIPGLGYEVFIRFCLIVFFFSPCLITHGQESTPKTLPLEKIDGIVQPRSSQIHSRNCENQTRIIDKPHSGQTSLCASEGEVSKEEFLSGTQDDFFESISINTTRGTATDRPNILFVIADDCTHLDIGCYGGQAHTPNIDRLASEGLRFTRCFQTSAMCSATRHTIYTGLYPVRSGAWANHTFVYPGVRSIVHDLQPLGYRVALSGKTHINPRTAFPFEYSAKPKSIKNGNNKKNNNSVIDFESVERLFSDSSKSGKPFALFACSNEPHAPYTKGKEFRERYNLTKLQLRPNFVDSPKTRLEYRNYLAEITFFDQEVGRLLSLLKKYGLAENTLVVVVSEQGSSFPGAKWTCYDKGLQSALIARWPGRIAANTQTDAMVEYVDLLPTFISAAGDAPRKELDGRSFLPVLLGKKDKHKSVVYGLQTSRGILNGPPHYAIRSIRNDRFKLVVNLSHDQEFKNLIVEDPFFLEWKEKAASGDPNAAARVKSHIKRPPVELYDIQQDPMEMQNLADVDTHADTIANLQKQLESWMASQGDRGLETELNAYKRMTGGNPEVKKFHQLQGLTRKQLFAQPSPEQK